MASVAIELDGVLGDTRPLYDAWLEDVSRRAHVDPQRLDEELPNWRVLLERFAEDHAPVYLRPSAPATAALRRLQGEGVRVGVFTDAPEELARIAASHLGATRRIEVLEAGPGALERVLAPARPGHAGCPLSGRLADLMESHELTDRQLEALLERLDRIAAELERMNRRQESREELTVVAHELRNLNESLQAIAYAALGQQGPQVRRRRTLGFEHLLERDSVALVQRGLVDERRGELVDPRVEAELVGVERHAPDHLAAPGRDLALVVVEHELALGERHRDRDDRPARPGQPLALHLHPVGEGVGQLLRQDLDEALQILLVGSQIPGEDVDLGNGLVAGHGSIVGDQPSL